MTKLDKIMADYTEAIADAEQAKETLETLESQKTEINDQITEALKNEDKSALRKAKALMEDVNDSIDIMKYKASKRIEKDPEEVKEAWREYCDAKRSELEKLKAIEKDLFEKLTANGAKIGQLCGEVRDRRDEINRAFGTDGLRLVQYEVPHSQTGMACDFRNYYIAADKTGKAARGFAPGA